ncbi:MAG: hypothetical protein AMXMBFR56_77560 [Polyangiaceae bacterium]
MPGGAPITLKEVQLRLGVPQHVLIHLCEKGVIEPDFAETSGRGKRREFSERNAFEFGVALALRRLELPVATAALVVRLLRSFTKAVAKTSPGFALPDALVEREVGLTVHLYDGDAVVLAATGAGFKRPLLLGARLVAPPRVAKLDRLPQEYEAHLEVNLAAIARRVTKRA